MKNCWICGNIADSKEHKFKASDIKRIYGKKFDGYFIHENAIRIESYKDRILKFPEVICEDCNVKKTRSHDDAYDIFMNYCINNYELLLKNRKINFDVIFGKDWIEQKRNLYRYFAKHAGCKIITSDYPQDLKDLSNFILGANNTDKFVLKFELKMIIKLLTDFQKRERNRKFGHLYNAPTFFFGYPDNLNLAGWLSNHWITTNWVYGRNVSPTKKTKFEQRDEKLKIVNLDYYQLDGINEFDDLIKHFETGELTTLEKKINHYKNIIT